MHVPRSLGRTILAALTVAVLLPGVSPSAAGVSDSRDCRRCLARAEAKAEAARALRNQPDQRPEAVREAVDAAMGAYRTVIRRCPESIATYEGMGNFAFSFSRMDDAAFAYRGYLRARPDSAVAASRLGYIFMKGERYEQAVAVYESLLERHPDRVNDRKQYAIALQKAGRTEDAATQFREVAATTGDTKLNCNEAMLYADAKDGEKTMRSALRGLAARSESEGCLLYAWEKGLGMIVSSILGRTPEANQLQEARAACEAERARAVEMLSGANDKALSVIEEKTESMLDRLAKLAVIDANRHH